MRTSTFACSISALSAFLDAGEMVACVLGGEDEFVERQLRSRRVAVLRHVAAEVLI
jgi:hypothetical protein